jgi:phage/plasmid-like protein (TIGR03299 family)
MSTKGENNMAHNVETMAYAGELPWHGLGVAVDNDLAPQEMLVAAGLDWSVEKQDLITASGIVVPGKKGLVRTSDNTLLDVVGTDWNPVQNNEAFDFFNEYVTAGDMEMHTAGSLRNGQITWALAKTKESFELFKGDVTENYLLFTNPHKYGSSIDIRMTPIRVVCNNTLSFALDSLSNDMFRMSHKVRFDADYVKEQMGIAREKLDAYKNVVEFIGSKRFTNESITNYFNDVFGKPSGQVLEFTSRNAQLAYDTLNTQPGAKYAEGTFWQAFNTVTYLTDHVFGRNHATRLDSAWFGNKKNLKSKALNKAVEYAEAA